MNLYSVLTSEAILNNAKHEECLNYQLGINKNFCPEPILAIAAP